MPFDKTTMNRSCTKCIPSWKDKYSVVCYTSTKLCVAEHLKCPEEQFVVKYSLTVNFHKEQELVIGLYQLLFNYSVLLEHGVLWV